MMILINAIFGGMMIAIASYIYLQVGGIVGAFLFSIGLLTILNMNFKLYTGAIGFVHLNPADMQNITTILVGNLIGVCLLLFFPHSAAIPLVAAKLALPLGLVMIKAIVCGMFMYTAVSCFRNSAPYMVPLCVAGFILFSGEHCIADLCYFIASGSFCYEMFPFFVVTLIGNSLGAILIDRTKVL